MAEDKTLKKLFAELRSKSLREANKAEPNIRRIYKAILKDMQGFVGEEYAKMSKDGTLTYSTLQQKGEYARFLREVTQRLDGLTPTMVDEILEAVDKTYELSYAGMVDAVSNAKNTKELSNNLSSVRAATPETVKRSVENSIDKLTLKDTLEYNRQGIVYNIRKNISMGLVNGDRYTEMAKRITNSLDGDYKKAIRIVRTETHKVTEQGFCDAAIECNDAIKRGKSGLVMTKTWKTIKDSRVRSSHSSMEGKTVLADEEFELPSGATAMSPGDSGVASEDCNCRCYCSYDLMTVEEYEKKTGNKYKEG